APFGPKKPVTRPGPTSKIKPSTAVTAPYRLVKWSIFIIWPSRRAGWLSCSPHRLAPGQGRDAGPMTSGRPARQPGPMTTHQVTDRPRRHLLLLVASWLPAAEEDNEHVGSSGLNRPLSWLAMATGVATFGFFAGTLVLRALIAGRGHD